MQPELKLHRGMSSNPLKNEYMNEQPLSYIIGLKEPGHCKESLSGLCGPKMFTLHEPRHECQSVNNHSTHINEDLTICFHQAALYLVEEVDNLG